MNKCDYCTVTVILDFNFSTFKVCAIFELDNFYMENSVSKYLLESRNNFNLKKHYAKCYVKSMCVLKRIKSKMYKEDVFVHSNDALPVFSTLTCHD